jgi:hypothetical protein
MTYQVVRKEHGANKYALQCALNAAPERVSLHDPAVFGPRGGGAFTGADLVQGEVVTVVMDPQTRRRFAQIKRMKDGTFVVL